MGAKRNTQLIVRNLDEEIVQALRGRAARNGRSAEAEHHAAFLEDETGVLAPGRWADLTVLSVDPLEAGLSDPASLLEGSVILTVVAGEIAYQQEP